MTKKELIEDARRKLREFANLPVEEQFRQLQERGLVDEQGEVLWNLELARKREAEQARAKGQPASPPRGSAADH
jgi:hypothetical protein